MHCIQHSKKLQRSSTAATWLSKLVGIFIRINKSKKYLQSQTLMTWYTDITTIKYMYNGH